MNQNSLKRDLELLYEIGCFRLIPRTWIQFQNPAVVNNAEHTFRMAFTALVLASHEGDVNQEKILKMALMHDIPESRTGDVHYLSRMYVKRNEDLALKEMVKGTVLAKELNQLWKEYKQRKTLEAKIVKDADTLDIDLELNELAVQGNKVRDIWKKQREVVRKTFYTQSAKDLWQSIQGSNPHDWHLNGRTRFNNGDWKKLRKQLK